MPKDFINSGINVNFVRFFCKADMMSVIKNLFLITVSPQIGWDDINKSGHTTPRVLMGGFYPMLVVLMMASFVPMCYDSVEWPIFGCIVHAIAELAGFLATFYITTIVLGGMFADLLKSNSSSIRMHNFVAYNVMFLIFIEVLNNCMAYLFTPVFFLYLYAPVIISKGVVYLGVTNGSEIKKLVTITSVMLLLTPYIIRKLLELMIRIG